jgi:hypothetical protein
VLHLNIFTFVKVGLSYGIEKQFGRLKIEGYFNKPTVFEGVPFSRLLGITISFESLMITDSKRNNDLEKLINLWTSHRPPKIKTGWRRSCKE